MFGIAQLVLGTQAHDLFPGGGARCAGAAGAGIAGLAAAGAGAAEAAADAEGGAPASGVPVSAVPQPPKASRSRSPAAVVARRPPRRPEFMVVTVMIQSAQA